VKVEDIRMCIESLKNEVKGLGRVMEGVKWIKVKYTHSGNTLKIPFLHQLIYLQ
jgi:hypothetical protein